MLPKWALTIVVKVPVEQLHRTSFDNLNLVDEQARLQVLHDLAILDTPEALEFDILTRLARQLSGCKIAVISLIDRDRQWFKSKCGLSINETPREDAFCAHAVLQNNIMIIPDARKDARFFENPLVTGQPGIIFYAGIPLIIRNDAAGQTSSAAIGTLCVIHDQPHTLSPDQQNALTDLAALVVAMVERHCAMAKMLTLANEHAAHVQQIDIRNRQFRQAERMANIGSWRLTLADNITHWSDQVYAIHELPVGIDPSLANALEFYPDEARIIVSSALTSVIETGEPFAVETDFVTANGAARRVRSIGEVELQNGNPVAVIGVFQDITDQFKMEARLLRMAQFDDLTGLPNRAHFNSYFDTEIARSKDTGFELTLLLMDLDGFKSVNDQYGHLAGDIVLQAFAQSLATSSIKDYFFARLGGDEFVAVINNSDDCQPLQSVLLKLLVELQTTGMVSGSAYTISATIGASQYRGGDITRSDLLHRADNALYDAKRVRRGSAKIDGVPDHIILSGNTGLDSACAEPTLFDRNKMINVV